MKKKRLIARLDIKNSNLIKGIHLEGLRKLGNPNEFSLDYYNQGIDEIIYMDAVASLYGRNSLLDMVKVVAKDIFIPLTVGGGIRTIEDAKQVLRAGADKIAINTAAIQDPSLITQLANQFGSQCVVLSVEAKRNNDGTWEAFTDNGREHTHKNVVSWVEEAVTLGAGEVLLTSIDQEGTLQGFDNDLLNNVSNVVNVPVIASGGFGRIEDFNSAILSGADAVAVAHCLHYKKSAILDIKSSAAKSDIPMRMI